MTDILPAPRPVLVAFVVVAVANLVSVSVGISWLEVVTKPFLCALLLVWAWLACDRRPPRLLMAGLVAALAGDELLGPAGDAWFVVGMAAFLVMQVCYIVGFLRLGAGEALLRRRWVAVAWALLWLVLQVVLGPSLGALQIPIAVYSAALTTMAACAVATGDRRIGVGGVLFLISDLLIGLGAADLDVPASGFLVMSTYALAQLLIVTGWVQVVRTPALTGAAAAR
jgi:uncharacterized membrane protein YhhN